MAQLKQLSAGSSQIIMMMFPDMMGIIKLVIMGMLNH